MTWRPSSLPGASSTRAPRRFVRRSARRRKGARRRRRRTPTRRGVWLSENRDKIVKSLPKDHKITDVAKAGGEQWKKLAPSAKKPYEDKFAKKQVEYKEAMEAYKKAKGDAGGDEEEDEEEEAEEPADIPQKKSRKAGA
mmetsp:Transcript_98544/g.283191  ORF Transcript_98544/g.283191 Transcript_98544/m.283191 type:complete len:139 (-) Transcript_98544:29-445(-)